MRIKSLRATQLPPISLFAAEDLSDVVVIAGRNGVGKTRLVQGLVDFFRNPHNSQYVQLIVEATSETEFATWGKRLLDTAQPADAQKLAQTLQQQRRRANWKSSVVQFESDRSITQISPYQFTWDFTDPWKEIIGWDRTFSGFRNRFQDMLHSIFRKVRSHREDIARRADDLRTAGEATMSLDWEDPLAPFKAAFRQLLAPKELADVNPQRQTLEFRVEGSQQILPVTSLSSGEREVVNIVFDFILLTPEDCIVIFDEPELHLHPELSYKLIQTLRTVGGRNQFIFCTHSPDIITASLDQSVIFVAPPSAQRSNQAVPVSEHDETNQALRLLGQSVGIVALGKRLVLIEGTSASLDKQAYGSILRDRFPNLVLVPAGGKGLITSFAQLIEEVLDRTIWGVEFFMLCDRDAVPVTVSARDLESKSRGRLRVLPRYHLENFFLDPQILAKVFDRLERDDSPLRDPVAIESKLRELANNLVSYAAALLVSAQVRTAAGNVDIMPKRCHALGVEELKIAMATRAAEESKRVGLALDPSGIVAQVERIHRELIDQLRAADDAWKMIVPGKPLLNMFAKHANMQVGRLKQAYITEAAAAIHSPFDEIVQIFADFNRAAFVDAV